jgi:hypothetical protein
MSTTFVITRNDLTLAEVTLTVKRHWSTYYACREAGIACVQIGWFVFEWEYSQID